MNMELLKLTEDEFYTKFTLVKNHFDPNASWGGNMFETYSDEMMYCFELAKTENRVWTIVECDDTEYDPDAEDVEDTEDEVDNSFLCIVSGFHYLNRLGFFVTQEPYEQEIEVKLD